MPPKHLDPPTSAEWKILKAVFERGACGAREIIDDAESLHDWSASTVKTLLRRLVEKGHLRTRRVGTSTAPALVNARTVSVRLFIDRDPDTPEVGLVADVGAWLGTERRRAVLVPEATGLEVRYRSALLSGREWHPSWISSSVMPAGVELAVHGGADLHALLRTPVRVALVGGR
jgi:hypothetical protein